MKKSNLVIMPLDLHYLASFLDERASSFPFLEIPESKYFSHLLFEDFKERIIWYIRTFSSFQSSCTYIYIYIQIPTQRDTVYIYMFMHKNIYFTMCMYVQ